MFCWVLRGRVATSSVWQPSLQGLYSALINVYASIKETKLFYYLSYVYMYVVVVYLLSFPHKIVLRKAPRCAYINKAKICWRTFAFFSKSAFFKSFFYYRIWNIYMIIVKTWCLTLWKLPRGQSNLAHQYESTFSGPYFCCIVS